MGLEVSIDLMAALAGARHAVEYKETVVLKGFSTMLLPVRRNKDNVQWHLITSVDADSHLPYEEGFQRCPNRASLSEVNLECLRDTRAIIDWCCVAENALGRSDVHYENIDYSGAREADTGLKVAGGSLGFQQFGLAQVDFTLGPRDGKYHFQRTGPYRSIISASEKTLVLLYDTFDKRAWLVSASSVMSHIAQHRNYLESYTVQNKRVSFQTDGSAKESLLLNAGVRLYDDDAYYFRDMISSVWSLIEYLIAQKVIQDSIPGRAIKTTFQDILSGFEFKAIVEERSPFRQKQCEIQKSSGGWASLIRDTDALVLFANGLGDIISPQKCKDNARPCHSWKRMPIFSDYLSAQVKTIIDLYDTAGCRLSREFLTSTGLRWHRGKSCLFEPCSSPDSFQCLCNRLQQIVPECAIGDATSPGLLAVDGAVIFGSSGSLLGNLCPAKTTRKTGLYSQPNETLNPVPMQDTSQPKTTLSEGFTLFDEQSCESREVSSMTSDMTSDAEGPISRRSKSPGSTLNGKKANDYNFDH